jgi:hypothetical protein
MAQGVERRTLLAGIGAGPGGSVGSWGFGIRDWVCHMETSSSVVAWADRDFADGDRDAVEWEGNIDEEVA